MKRSYIIFGFIAVLSSVVLYQLSTTDDNSKAIGADPTNHSEPLSSANDQKPNLGELDTPALTELKPVTDEIEQFNTVLRETYDTQGLSIKKTLLSDLKEMVNENNLEEVSTELSKIFDQPAENQALIREHLIYCKALEKREKNTLAESIQTSPSGELFLLALQQSNNCAQIGTDADPFYISLSLARKGDKFAQLFLAEDLGSALDRGLINPQLYPLEYHEIRSEVIGYLKQLSGRGVAKASVMLYHLYGSDRFLIPQDRFLQYYYALLSEQQNNDREVVRFNTEDLYDRLSEAERARADRLQEKLK